MCCMLTRPNRITQTKYDQNIPLAHKIHLDPKKTNSRNGGRRIWCLSPTIRSIALLSKRMTQITKLTTNASMAVNAMSVYLQTSMVHQIEMVTWKTHIALATGTAPGPSTRVSLMKCESIRCGYQIA